MKRNEAIRVLRACEVSLRALLGEAAKEGDYPAALELTRLASSVAALAASVEATTSDPPAPAPKAAPTRSNTKPTTKPADEYPKFFRRGDDLIKVGWSKKDHRQYTHRAPRQVVTTTAAAVRKTGENGKSFTGDALLPVRGSDGSEPPAYQVYVALAWLKHLGLVKAIGQRGGYTLGADKPTEAALASAWPALPEWTG